MTTITARGGSPEVGPPRAKRDNGQFGPRSLTQQSPRYGERVVKTVLIGAALLSVLVTVGIVVSLLLPALSFFREVNVGEFLFGTRWTPRFSGHES